MCSFNLKARAVRQFIDRLGHPIGPSLHLREVSDLQDYYVKDWAVNFMFCLYVDDMNAWVAH